MSHELDGCWAKIERAEESINQLNVEFTAFLTAEPKPYRIVRNVEPDGITHIWKIFSQGCLPPRFSVIAGEIIHHLRSSLNLLLCAMVRHRGNTVERWHHFPVCSSIEKFKKAVDARAIEGISLTARNLIESVQPYHAPQVDTSFLAILHDLDVREKHQLLVILAGAAFLGEVEFPFKGLDPTIPEGAKDQFRPIVTTGVKRRATEEGEEILRVRLDRVRPNMTPEAQFAPFITFEKFGPVELQPVIPSLVQAGGYVADVVRRFAGEFI